MRESCLHVETFGSGAPLLLIHGWGMHGGMWGALVEKLAEDFCVQVVDLPGHGFSGKSEGKRGKGGASVLPLSLPSSPFPIDNIVAELSAKFAQPLSVCGWSLGGQIALRWAQLEQHKIQRLVLVASTPCFVQKDDWTCAMASETLTEFAAALQGNPMQTLRRFIGLQVRGSERERELLTSLRAALLSRGEPNLDALKSGLEILRDSDQRAALQHLAQPTLIMSGERDTLTPQGASEYMTKTLPNARLVTIAGAAHTPFLSHPDEFVMQLKNFMNSKND